MGCRNWKAGIGRLESCMKELVHEVERLSNKLVSKDQYNSKRELLCEDADLIAKHGCNAGRVDRKTLHYH